MTSARRVGYFGPAGTFTEQALLTQADLAALEHLPYRTVPDVLDAVESGEVDLGFVPIENSIEGTVNFTQDALVFDHDLLIQREVVLDIEHCVLARPGTTLDNVKVLLSIPVATAQCHAFIRRDMPEVEVRAANSTAEAARLVAEDSSDTIAAIAPENAARLYGLDVLRRNIADHDGNQTRFVVVGKNRI
ncbi:MAG: prephenate dehydratase, partial [Actinobacteria bacterium]|nr:prephenate dehydratase [Actinomycetota bacterium]